MLVIFQHPLNKYKEFFKTPVISTEERNLIFKYTIPVINNSYPNFWVAS